LSVLEAWDAVNANLHCEDYRWFPEGKVVFVAPTKPLVSQQIEASHNACGIPGTDATEMTGEIDKFKRERLVNILLFPSPSYRLLSALVAREESFLHDPPDFHE